MAKEKETKEKDKTEGKKSALTALKDFRITQNEYDRIIKAGDDLSDVPEVYLANLKTEGVI